MRETNWAVWVEKPIVGDGPTWITTKGRVITGTKLSMSAVANSMRTMQPELRQYDGDGPQVNVFDTTWKMTLRGRR